MKRKYAILIVSLGDRVTVFKLIFQKKDEVETLDTP